VGEVTGEVRDTYLTQEMMKVILPFVAFFKNGVNYAQILFMGDVKSTRPGSDGLKS
jgi:hypothetical protein